METSGVQFGTSGVRGLVVDMTDQVCWTYVTGYLQHLKDNNLVQHGGEVGIAGDLRSSTPSMMNTAAQAVLDSGFQPVNYGRIPSPAIALYGLYHSIPTIMVTGSHIPDDRNGIKFNTPNGEILKTDEQGIKSQLVVVDEASFSANGGLLIEQALPKFDNAAELHYIDRFIQFFPKNCLQNKRVGVYEHSSVASSCLKIILQALGADVTSLGYSEKFVSVDTEAIRSEDVALGQKWAKEYGFDCIISTDGDGDRPLVSDEFGHWLRGDVAGILCAKYLAIDTVVTPVSSNTAVEDSELFKQVIRTRIGSPYVIEAMNNARGEAIAGYEANGGFLQKTDLKIEDKTLAALPTRDAVIVPIAILMLSIKDSKTISGLLADLPQRFTYSDRLTDFPTKRSQQILADMVASDDGENLQYITNVFKDIGEAAVSIDQTDGLRITFENDEVIHLRPSGNAPELRCYNEADSQDRAQALNQRCMRVMAAWR